MNKLLSAIILIICSLSPYNLFSQELTFDSSTHNFGVIAEDGGNVSHTFTLNNTGNSPIVIVTASSSCGCTVPQYSRQPIAVGSSTPIVVTYDPMDRPGKFSKTVQLVVAPGNKRYTLTIEGDVVARTKSTEEQYPFDMGGGLRLSANYYPLSRIEQGKRVETQIPYVNTSKKAVKVVLRPLESSSKLEVEQHLTIPAGAKGSLAVAYDMAKHRGYYGVLSDRYAVEVGGKESKYNLIINAHAVDSFTKDERSSPAICNVSARVLRVGAVKKGKASAKQTLSIENTGISNLVVRDIALGDGLKSSLKSGVVVKPSSTVEFTVWVDGAALDYGSFSRYITLTVNDPDQPMQRIRVVGSVEG